MIINVFSSKIIDTPRYKTSDDPRIWNLDTAEIFSFSFFMSAALEVLSCVIFNLTNSEHASSESSPSLH